MSLKTSFKIVFNRANRLNKHGEGLIQVECRKNSHRAYFSTNVRVRKDQFSNGLVCNHPLADKLNAFIYQERIKIEEIELGFIVRGIYPSLQQLKNAVNEAAAPSAKFADFGRNVINASDRKELTKSGYETLFNSMDKFMSGSLVTDIDYDYLVKYDKWMTERGIAHNTRVGRFRQIKALINEAIKRDIITKNPFDLFKIQAMKNKTGFLTSTELKKLEKLEVQGKYEIVRDAFLFGCYTGLRFSDIISLRSSHIKNGWITKTMVKTSFKVEIPIKDIFDGKAMLIIEKYGSIENLVSKIGCNASVNKTLKEILSKIKPDNKFTFHTSRHTFASLMLQMGVPITSVQKMLGHQKITTTQIYGEVNKETIANDLKKVLKKVKREKATITVSDCNTGEKTDQENPINTF